MMRARYFMHKLSSSPSGLRLLCVALACLYAGLTACSSADDELQRFIEDTKKEPGGRVEPIPEIKPYESFVYSASDMRSPFLPSSPGSGAGRATRPQRRAAPRPDPPCRSPLPASKKRSR